MIGVELPDEDLLSIIAAGGAAARDAEAVILRRYGPRARLYGLRHLRDEQRARDLAQTVLVGLLQAMRGGRIDQPSRLSHFVLGACRNVALRMRETDGRAEAAAPDELVAVMDAVAGGVELIDRRALVLCLHRLDERARQVVAMSVIEGHSAEDVARAVSTTAGNVRVMRHRAIASLRRCLDGAGEEAR